MSTSTSALLCLALNIYYEARGEPHQGQVAVAMVTMNRADWDTDNVCAVVYRPRQFSWTVTPLPLKEPAAWHRAKSIAESVFAGEHSDPTEGATHFHTSRVTPIWRKSLRKTAQIGQHIFYAPKQ